MAVEAPYGCCEPVINVVRHAHDVVLAVEGVHGDNGPEDLLARGAAGVRKARDYGRHVKKPSFALRGQATCGWSAAAAEDCATFRFG